VRRAEAALKIDATFGVALPVIPKRGWIARGKRFLAQLQKQTALLISGKPVDAAKAKLVVHTDHASKEVQELGEDESYTLEVTPTGAKLDAANPLGVLARIANFLATCGCIARWICRAPVAIKDQPRFAWRGLLIDSSRHFTPVDVLKRNLDGMEAVKLNVFHWHISDNQGFRAESKKFPKLTSMGSAERITRRVRFAI